jgi:hypothetical protein
MLPADGQPQERASRSRPPPGVPWPGGRSQQDPTGPPAAAEAEPAEGPIDDAGSLVTVVGEQNASGWPQGIVAVVAVYALVRLGGLLVASSGAGSDPALTRATA